MSKKGSKKGFWSFLRCQKAPLPESETSVDTGALAGEQEALDFPDDGSFDALFTFLDKEERDSELKSSIARAEPEDRESQSCAQELSEETEIQAPEVPEEMEIPEADSPELEPLKKEELKESRATERKFLKEMETPELKAQEATEPEPLEKPERSDPREDRVGSGRVLERLGGLEEQISSLESCIIERLNSHR